MERSTAMEQAPKPAPKPQPIRPLDTTAARVFTQIHPVLLLSGYLFQFPRVVADPISALTSSLLPLAVLQVAYTTICLPATGSSASTSDTKAAAKAGPKKKALTKSTGGLGTNLGVRTGFVIRGGSAAYWR